MSKSEMKIRVDNMKSNYYLPILLVLFSHIANGQKSWYVGLLGTNRTTAGQSVSNPFRTVEYASDFVSPGDTINVLAGEYKNATYGDTDIWNVEATIQLSNLNGTKDKYIVIRPLPGHKVLLKGDSEFIFKIRTSSYVRIEGFEIEGEVDRIPLATAIKYQFAYKDAGGNIKYRVPEGSTPAQVLTYTNLPILDVAVRPSYFSTVGLLVQVSHHIDVINNTIHHCPGVGLRFQGCDYFNAFNNKVHNCSRRSSIGNHGFVVHLSESIDTFTGTKSYISGNVVYDNYNEVYSWSEQKNFITPVLDEGKGISMQKNNIASGWKAGRIRIENNVTYGNGFSGIHINEGERIDVVNNTAYNNTKTGRGTNTGISVQSGNDIKFINNIAVSVNNFGGFAMSAGNTTGLVVESNLIVGTTDQDVATVGKNQYQGDPSFKDISNLDFQILQNSAAIDKANGIYAPLTDILKKNRDSKPDIGAYEYFAPLPSPKVWIVAPNGSDATGDGSLAKPFKSITKASQVVGPGDTVFVRDGVYRNASFGSGNIWETGSTANIVCKGQPDRMITFKPYKLEKPVIEFDNNYGILISQSSYVRVEGFEVKGINEKITFDEAQKMWGVYRYTLNGNTITGDRLLDIRSKYGNINPTRGQTYENLVDISKFQVDRPTYYNGRGIVANSSQHIEIVNNKVHDTPSSGIRAQQSDYVKITANEVYNCTYWTTQGVGAIVMAEGLSSDSLDVEKMIFERNYVHHNENRLVSWNPTKDFVTYIIDEGSGIFLTRNSDTYTKGKVRITNNICTFNGASGIMVHFTNKVLANNNTLYFNGSTNDGSPGGVGYNTASDVGIFNNIIFSRPNKWAIGQTAANNNRISIANNIVFNQNGPQSVHNLAPTGWINTDPKLESPSADIFKLTSSSPAMNKSNIDYSPSSDFYGVKRDTLPDIGAIEFFGQIYIDPDPNGRNDSLNLATSLNLNDGGRTDLIDNKDIDFFRIEANASGVFKVTISSAAMLPDDKITLGLYKTPLPDGLIYEFTGSPTAFPFLDLIASKGCRPHIKVSKTGSSNLAEYAIKVIETKEDTFEINNNFNQAKLCVANQTNRAQLHGRAAYGCKVDESPYSGIILDQDFFKFSISGCSVVNLRVMKDDTLRTLKVQLYDQNFTPVESMSKIIFKSVGEYSAFLKAGDYFIRFYQDTTQNTYLPALSYSFSYNLVGVEGLECTSLPDQATAINCDQKINGSIYPKSDMDCFNFSTLYTDTIFVRMNQTPVNQNVTLRLTGPNPSQTEILSVTGGKGNPLLLMTPGAMPKGSYNFCVSGSDVDPTQYSFTIDCSQEITATQDFISPHLSIYPNPGYEYVYFRFKDLIADSDSWFTIISIGGEEIMKKRIVSDSEIVDVSQWQAGMYFVKLSINGTTTYQKLIKTVQN
jgi:hypothetical protein